MNTLLPMVELAVVTTTVGSEADATGLAERTLVQRLAACVQVEPLRSHYVWQGVEQADAEWRVLAKTVPACVPALLALWQAEHPYQLPQLVVQAAQASAAYGDWVAASVEVPDAGPLRC